MPALTVRSRSIVIDEPRVVVPPLLTMSKKAIPADVTVPPTKTIVLVPASTVPAAYVQL